MAKKVQAKDIIQPGIFDEATQSAEGLLKVVKTLQTEFKNTLKISGDLAKTTPVTDAESLTATSKALDKINISFAESKRLATERLKLEAKLAQSRDDFAKDNAKLKVQNQEQNKVLKQQARENLGLVDTYEKTSKQLVKSRRALKNLILEGKTAGKEFKDLSKEVQDLDQALKDADAAGGQFQRNVGNYPDVAGKAKNSFGSLSGFILGAFSASFEKSRSTAREFQGAIERVTNVVQVFAFAIITFAQNKAIPAFDNALLKIQSTILDLKKTFTIGEESQKFAKELEELNKKIEENNTKIETSTTGFEDFGKVLSETDQTIIQRLEREDALIDKTAILTKTIQDLEKEEEVLDAKIGASTTTFAQRNKLLDELQQTQQARLKLQRELADAELANAVDLIKNDLTRNGLAEKFNEEQIISLQFLKDKQQADAIGIDNLNRLTEATKALSDIEKEAATSAIQLRQERLQNARDAFEQELDFTLDIGDRQKSVNERRLADDRKTFEERRRIIDETTALLDDSFNEQIQLTENFIAESLEINEGLTGEEALKRVKELNLERIVGLEDEKQIRKELFEAGIADEITQNRIREIIIERKAALQDVADAEKDLADDIIERAEQQSEAINEVEQIRFERQIARQEELLENEELTNKRRIELTNELFEERLKQIQAQRDFELMNEELTFEERLAIQEQYINDFEALERDRVDAVEDANKKALESEEEAANKRREFFGEVLDALIEANRKQSEERQKAIDDEIAQSEERQNQLRELARKGSEDATDNLAFEQRREAELRQQKEQELRKAQQREFALTAVQTYNSKVQSGDPQPLNSTIRDLALLRAFVANIPAFYEGIEDTGNGGNLDSKGGFLSVLHPNERVITANQNQRIGDISNEELANIAHRYNEGLMIDAANMPTETALNNRFTSNNDILKGFFHLSGQMDKQNKILKDLPGKMPKNRVQWDELKKAFVEITETKERIIRDHYRNGELF